MKTLIRSFVLLAVLALPAIANAQTPAAPTDRFVWDQVATSLAEVNAWRFEIEIDGVVRTPAVTATCTGSGPFVCRTPIPAVTPSTHTVRVRAIDQSIIASLLFGDWSAPLSFRMRAVPASPTGMRIETASGSPGADNAQAGEEFHVGTVTAPGGEQ